MSSTLIDSIQGNEAEQTLRIYSLYRIVLAALILIVFLVQMNTAVDKAYWPNLFLITTGLYFLFSIVTHFYAGLRQQKLTNLELLIYFFVADIIALTMIAHASGGLSMGLSLIMTLTVASGGIFFRGRLSLLLAALASIATLLNVSGLIQLGVLKNNSLLNAGVLGAVFFGTAFMVQILVRRIEASQVLAAQKARELAYSEYLNQLIVKRMQTGVLVVDGNYKLQSSNQSALSLLGLPAEQRTGAQSTSEMGIPEPLLDSMRRWEQHPNLRTPAFRMSAGAALLQSEFMPLTDEDEGKVLIFLEDTSRARQQAQQIKLASLGRLTASIAHEIRNPLGAISHAAQLMKESETITDGDRRLCDIVHNHSQRMNRTIENVLQLSRRNASEPEKFELGDWLIDFISAMTQSQPDAKIDLSDKTQGVEVSFDPSQLDQVMSNLSSNGLRYSKKHTGKSTLSIIASVNSSDGLPKVDIIDHGVGVAESEREQLFEPFYTSESEGTGLGLFIARELCEANQSRLDYLPTDKKQSRFRITFAHPMKKLANADSKWPSAATPREYSQK